MGRIVKKGEYNAKRDEILNAAVSLIYAKGYEQMTIQDILDTLNISRGAFYHYFESKMALIEAYIERSAAEGEKALLQVVQDPKLSAIQKIQAYYDLSTKWKATHMDLILDALRGWYSDENALIRQKTMAKSLKYVSRLLEPIIRQGIEEGVFTTAYPAEVAVIFAGVTLNLSDTVAVLMLGPISHGESFRKAQIFMDAYFVTIERILGTPAGSFKVLDVGVFKDWFAAPDPAPAAGASTEESPSLTPHLTHHG